MFMERISFLGFEGVNLWLSLWQQVEEAQQGKLCVLVFLHHISQQIQALMLHILSHLSRMTKSEK